MTKFSYTSFMNCRIASSVCGDVGFAATEVDEAREDPPPRAEAAKVEPIMEPPRVEEEPEVEEAVGSWGGWCRRRKRTPEPVRKAEM